MFGNYIRLLEKIDAFAAEIRDKHSLSFNCGPGCSTCCVSGITVWRVEFDHLVENIKKTGSSIPDPGSSKEVVLRASSIEDRGSSCCFLNDDGHCAIYDLRPAVCRLWGTPLMIPAGHEHE